jgi:hypothetical protein
MIRNTIIDILVWISVPSWGIWVGGTIYQMIVVKPMWSAGLPESLQSFLRNTNFTRDVLKFFGPRWMPVRGLALLLPFVGWNLQTQRPFFVVAACCVAFGFAFTLGYVYRINAVLFSEAVANRDADEIRSLAQRWIFADRVRFVVGCVGYLAMLWALSRPIGV